MSQDTIHQLPHFTSGIRNQAIKWNRKRYKMVVVFYFVVWYTITVTGSRTCHESELQLSYRVLMTRDHFHWRPSLALLLRQIRNSLPQNANASNIRLNHIASVSGAQIILKILKYDTTLQKGGFAYWQRFRLTFKTRLRPPPSFCANQWKVRFIEIEVNFTINFNTYTYTSFLPQAKSRSSLMSHRFDGV